MSDLYNVISDLCKDRGITGYKMCKDVGLQPSIMTDLKKGRRKGVSAETADRIASYFGVSVGYLLGNDPIIDCEDCGLQYNSSDERSVKLHTERHAAWEKAVDKFGFCWASRYREELKGEARWKIEQGDLTEDQYIEAQLTIFKALFSRSLEANDYSLNHADFPSYVAILLNQDYWKQNIKPEIYKKLVTEYGTKNGIPFGSHYVTIKNKKSSDKKSELPIDTIPYVRGRRLPILGSIPAGIPVLASENIQGYDYANVPEDEDYFFLRVKGDSMINAHIFNGDLVLVKSQSTADNGDIVVCIVNGDEATLKRFRRGKNAILLIPENSEYQPIMVSLKEFENGYARIIGVAKEVKHKL